MIPGSGIFRTQLPSKFKAGGINCGVRLYRPDLGIIISEIPATAVAVYTQNRFRAAPIKHCEQCLPADNIKAIITNSGEANAATGTSGEQANWEMAKVLAKNLDCSPKQVLTASTGVIGKPLSLSKITAAIPELIQKTTDIAENFATAILTTDLVPKTVYKDILLSQGKVRITGICKGSGMIHPNMATMLAYFLTDLKLPATMGQKMLRDACAQSFNMISVDGETSTNDCAFLMANGASGVTLISPADKEIFYAALLDIAIILAKSIARDGEGASKLIEANVYGAINAIQARAIAKAIITSPLVKTALYGQSPNWGRIIARIGNENVSDEMLSNCEIAVQGFTLFKSGMPVSTVETELLKERLAKDHIIVNVRFTAGMEKATAWGCDLSEHYVKINAEYV